MSTRKLVQHVVFAALCTSIGAFAQGVSNDVVKIGVLTDFNGVFSDFSGQGSLHAVKMAVEDFGGRVLGKPIEILSADHQNKADIGSALAREWYDAQNVDTSVPMCPAMQATRAAGSANGCIERRC